MLQCCNSERRGPCERRALACRFGCGELCWAGLARASPSGRTPRLSRGASREASRQPPHMSSRRQRRPWPAIVAFAVTAGGACTLSSDEFVPELVESVDPVGSGSAPATPPAGCRGLGCEEGEGSEPCL